MFLQRAHNIGNGGIFLTDRNIHTLDAISSLVNYCVNRNRRLTRLFITDN